MATNNFLIFDESLTAIDTDQEYLAETQRLSGVTPGLASPKMHNKLYRQCSVMAYAIANVLAARGFDADDSDPAGLVNAIQRAFAFSVNGNVPNGSGAVTAVRPIDAWPVGSLFMTFDNTNPASLLGGGTWVQIKGRYLLAADTGDLVDGSTTVGAMTKNVPLVSHTHSFSIGSSGAHTHSVSNLSTSSAGGHSHTRGSMNITGTFGTGGLTPMLYKGDTSGAFYNSGTNGHKYGDTNTAEDRTSMVTLDASRNWTGSTSAVANHSHTFSVSIGSSGAHTHSGTTASSGTSASFDVRPASIYVYMWRRTA